MLDSSCCRRGYHIVAVNGSDTEALQQITFKILFTISSVQKLTSTHRGDNINEPRGGLIFFPCNMGMIGQKGSCLPRSSSYEWLASVFTMCLTLDRHKRWMSWPNWYLHANQYWEHNELKKIINARWVFNFAEYWRPSTDFNIQSLIHNC